MSLSNESAFDEPKPKSIENALGTSLGYQVPKILPLQSTLYILERVAYTSFPKQRHYAAKILLLWQHYT